MGSGYSTLSTQFDVLFATTTGYDALDQRISITRTKKNGSELGTRMQARIRDIHFQTVSENGTKCKDTFCTIIQTARKLGVNIYQYIYDRVARKFEMTSLADMILLKAEQIPKPA